MPPPQVDCTNFAEHYLCAVPLFYACTVPCTGINYMVMDLHLHQSYYFPSLKNFHKQANDRLLVVLASHRVATMAYQGGSPRIRDEPRVRVTAEGGGSRTRLLHSNQTRLQHEPRSSLS